MTIVGDIRGKSKIKQDLMNILDRLAEGTVSEFR